MEKVKRGEKKTGSNGPKAVLFCLAITVVTGVGIAAFWQYQQTTIVEPATQTAQAASDEFNTFIASLEEKRGSRYI